MPHRIHIAHSRRWLAGPSSCRSSVAALRPRGTCRPTNPVPLPSWRSRNACSLSSSCPGRSGRWEWKCSESCHTFYRCSPSSSYAINSGSFRWSEKTGLLVDCKRGYGCLRMLCVVIWLFYPCGDIRPFGNVLRIGSTRCTAAFINILIICVTVLPWITVSTKIFTFKYCVNFHPNFDWKM